MFCNSGVEYAALKDYYSVSPDSSVCRKTFASCMLPLKLRHGVAIDWWWPVAEIATGRSTSLPAIPVAAGTRWIPAEFYDQKHVLDPLRLASMEPRVPIGLPRNLSNPPGRSDKSEPSFAAGAYGSRLPYFHNAGIGSVQIPISLHNKAGNPIGLQWWGP